MLAAGSLLLPILIPHLQEKDKHTMALAALAWTEASGGLASDASCWAACFSSWERGAMGLPEAWACCREATCAAVGGWGSENSRSTCMGCCGWGFLSF
jgi:hypothetical protein